VPYAKPEINTLGDAASVIQNGLKFWSGAFDPSYGLFVLQPAYDLDE
jgi:hypothetical protein